MIRYFWPSDDEQLAGQWNDSHFDEDAGWWVNTLQAGAVFALAAALSVGATTTAAATGVYSQSQDDPAGSLAVVQFAQEEYWQNPVAPVNWPQPSAIVDDDIHVQFVSAFTPDDGDWRALVAPVPDGNFLRLPFLDPEEIPQLPTTVPVVDAGDIGTPQLGPQDPNWTLLFFLDDGSTVPIFQADEDFLPSQALPAPFNWPQPQQPFSTADEAVIEFVGEDVFWPQYVAPVPASLLWPQPFQFEQNESQNLVAFTDEIFWQNPTPPVPDSIWLLRQDLFEQTDATGSLTLVLDDAFDALVVPGVPQPDPGGLVLLQQWPFEQNEPAGSLRNNVDEDYWQNPVAPVNWVYPQAVTYDDFLGFPPATVVNEEYFSQLVAAVPDALKGLYGSSIYLPDVEEIPAGSLVPPPPVVPCFMPLPPAGPDGDTAISVFTQGRGAGNRPILALFCRVCQSGNPLVIRGDYAIWCQDCCAFVSKQDTYMGTVQAPGQFKNVF